MSDSDEKAAWPSGVSQLGLVTAAFALQWAWQTCSLYLPALERASLALAAPWYLNNVMGCAAYVVMSALAPRVQRMLALPRARVAAAALLSGAAALQAGLVPALAPAPRVVLACAMAVCGGGLFTVMRYDLLVALEGASRRRGALLGGTAAQLLLSLVVQTLPEAVTAGALLLMPWALALVLRAARLGLPAREEMPRVDDARPPIPAIPMLALFLLAIGLNFIRSAVDAGAAAAGAAAGGAATLGLVFLLTSAAMAVLLVLGREGVRRAAPFCTTLLMTLAAICVLEEGPAHVLAPVLSSSGFYVFVILFWQTTAGFAPANRPRTGTAWLGSATHAVYTAGLAIGALVYRAPASTGALAGPSLAVAVASVAAAFVLYMKGQEAEEAAREREALSFPPSLEGALAADCRILAQEAGLTLREEQVVAALAAGMGVRAAAARIGVGEATVKTHASHAYRKLGVHSREELMARVREADGRRVGWKGRG